MTYGRDRRRPRLASAVLAAFVATAALAPAAAAGEPQPRVEPRVVNGQVVDAATFASSWGFIVRLHVTTTAGSFRCAGSLVTDEIVVTAGHCVTNPSTQQPVEPFNVLVYGGSPDSEAPAFTRQAIAVEVAPGYTGGPAPDHDLALLRLDEPVAAATIGLSPPGEVPQTGPAEVAGWGCNETGVPPGAAGCNPITIDRNLRAATVPVQTAAYCNDGDGTSPGYGAGHVDPARQICAGAYDPDADAPDTCAGDSGGPLVVRDPAGPRLIGLTSYGQACGMAPGVYTGIGAYRAFIDPVVQQWDPVPVADGTFVPVVPHRVIDTRTTAALTPGVPRVVDVAAGGLEAANVRAVSLTVTAVDPVADGYLTVHPCDQAPPLASNLNYTAGIDVAASAAVGIDAQGAVCVTSFAATDVVVDVTGYWRSANAPTVGARYHHLLPQRLYDSRAYHDPLGAGETGELRVDQLADQPVGAVTLNVAAVDPTADGYLTVYPCDAPRPLASSVNFRAGETIANAVTVGASAVEEVCVYTFAETDLVIDVTGWFGLPDGDGGGRVGPVPPTRLADTRTSAPIEARGVLAVPVVGRAGVPADATGVIVNLTAVDPTEDGYLLAYPCGQPVPATSTVNVAADHDTPNLAFVPIGAGGAICVFSYGASHAVLDIAGYVTSA